MVLAGDLDTLDDIAGIGEQPHATRLFQGFEAKRRGRNLSLLVSRFAKIGTKRAPQPAKPQQRNRGRARLIAPIAEARAVTKDCDQLAWTTR